MKMNHKVIFNFLMLVVILALISCFPPDPDREPPIIGYQINDQTLEFTAHDYESGISLVELYIDSSIVASHTSDFNNLSYDLSGLGFGTFSIKIKATDREKNTAEAIFDFDYQQYIVDEDVTTEWISVFTYYGEVKFELVHEAITYTPNGNAPPKASEYKDYFYIRNYSPVNLIGWTALVIAYSESGMILWDWYSIGINIPYNSFFETNEYTGNSIVPAYYVVNFY